MSDLVGRVDALQSVAECCRVLQSIAECCRVTRVDIAV